MDKSAADDINFSSLFIPFTTKKALLYLTLTGLIVYFNMLFNRFVWDDLTFIIDNPQIHSFNLIHLFGPNLFNAGGYFRPVPAVYFSVVYALFGQQAFFYHMSQLCLHIIDSCLLFFFFMRFFKKPLSFFLSLVFLIHPIQVESVSYIGASQSELLFFFGLIAVLLCMRKKNSARQLTLLSLSLLISLLTKETSFLFLLIIMLYLLLFKKKDIMLFLPFLVSVAAMYFVIRLYVFHISFAANLSTPISSLSLIWRILNMPLIFFYYIKTFFYPAALGIDQRWIITKIDTVHFIFPVIADAVFFGLLVMLGFFCFKKNQRTFYLFLFFFLWFFIGMGALMQAVPLDMTVSDRWFYVPFAGLLGLIGLGQSLLPMPAKIYRTGGVFVLTLILIGLSMRTIVRNTNWSDPVSLYTHDVRIDQNADLDLMLGSTLEQSGLPKDDKKALVYLLTSDRMNPQKIALADTGVAYANLGEKNTALLYFKRALSAKNIYTGNNPDILVYEDLGVYYLDYENPLVSQAFAKKALVKFPKDVKLWLVLGESEDALGFKKAGLSAVKKAYSLDSDPSILDLIR
jgi:hypothetical protein